MKDICLRKNIFLGILIGEFILSFSLGYITHMYVLPLVPHIVSKIEDETVYIVENTCVKEEEAEITEIPNSTCPIRVDLSGALNDSGVYCFREDELLIDAIEKAGGFSKDVGLKFVSRKINLASPLENNQKIYIPYEEDLICTLQNFQPYTEEVEHLSEQNNNQNETESSSGANSDVSEQDSNSDTANGNSEDQGTSSCINLNTATKEQLMELNGVGESTAQKIIDARPFETVEDILNVSGIGDATFDKFKDKICL